MRKIKSVIIVMATLLSLMALTACGGKTNAPANNDRKPSPQPLEFFQTVWGAYSEDEMFPIAGGDFDHANMEQPDAYDIEKNKEAFMATFLLDDSMMAELNGDAATAQHMMNINTFCAAMVGCKDATKVKELAETYNKIIQANQWMCGHPDTVVVLQNGNLLIVAYGEDSLVQSFKKHCTEVEDPAQLIIEAPVEG